MKTREVLFGAGSGFGPAADGGLGLLRVFTGFAMALGHGVGKIPPPEKFVEGVAQLGFPAPGLFAWAAGCSELFGGVLLAIGLLTRPSAFFILCTMLVAAFIRHASDPFSLKEKALLYAAIALLFLLTGAGRYGVDALIRRRLRPDPKGGER